MGWAGSAQADESDPRTRTTPVIALTSSTKQTEILQRHNLGVSSFIVKPVTFERFVEAVQQLGGSGCFWISRNTGELTCCDHFEF